MPYRMLDLVSETHNKCGMGSDALTT